MTRAEIEAERMEMYLAGKSDREIAEKTHYARETITNWRWRHRLMDRKGIEAKAREFGARMQLWQDGMTDQQIADAQNRTIQAIRAWRWKNGLEANHG